MGEFRKVFDIKFEKSFGKTLRRYNIDGVEYESLEAMPPDVRRRVEAIQSETRADSSRNHEVIQKQQIEIDGNIYHSLDAVPPEDRKLLEGILKNGEELTLDALKEGGGLSIGFEGDSKDAQDSMPSSSKAEKRLMARWNRTSRSNGVLFFVIGVAFAVFMMLAIILGYILYLNR